MTRRYPRYFVLHLWNTEIKRHPMDSSVFFLETPCMERISQSFSQLLCTIFVPFWRGDIWINNELYLVRVAENH